MWRQVSRSPRARILALLIVTVIVGALFLGVGLLGRSGGAIKTNLQVPATDRFDVAVPDSLKMVGFVEGYGHRIEKAEDGLSRGSAELEDLQSQMKDQGTVIADQRTVLEELRRELTALRSREIATGAKNEQETSPATRPRFPYIPQGFPQDGTPRAAAGGAPPLPRLQKLTLMEIRSADEREGGDVIIPAGSFAEATLLTGVYAPTTDGAQPVHMRLDLTFIGPNRSRIPIQGAFLIGKAIGEPNSTRVVIQLDTLSYVRENGHPIEVPVNGYVADDDGVMGLAGQYVWRIQEAAGMAAVTGGISAAADAAAQQETTTLLNPLGGVSQAVTGDLGKFAVARGVSRASDEVGRIITRRLNEIVPAIYVPNGRKLTVVLIDGVTLEGLPVKELENETSRSPYAGLDLDR